MILKYLTNQSAQILKGFATSISIVISSVASVILFDFPITPGFVMGASTVLGSTMIYNKPSAAAAASNKGVPASSNKIGDNFASYNMEKEKNSNNDIRNSPSPIEAKSMLNVSAEKHKSTFVPAHEMPGPTYNVYSNNDTSYVSNYGGHHVPSDSSSSDQLAESSNSSVGGSPEQYMYTRAYDPKLVVDHQLNKSDRSHSDSPLPTPDFTGETNNLDNLAFTSSYKQQS